MNCPEGQHHHDDSWTTSSRATSSCWRCARRIPSTPAQKFGEARDAAVLRRGSSSMHASTQPTRSWLLESLHIRAQLAHPPLARMHAQKLICVRVARCLRQLWLISSAQLGRHYIGMLSCVINVCTRPSEPEVGLLSVQAVATLVAPRIE